VKALRVYLAAWGAVLIGAGIWIAGGGDAWIHENLGTVIVALLAAAVGNTALCVLIGRRVEREIDDVYTCLDDKLDRYP